jgi:hypothetical protein
MGNSNYSHTAPKQISSKDQAKIVSDIVERRNECRRWQEKDIYPELEEVWRSIKCRTKKIYKFRNGRETSEEDTSRTNVDMGLGNLIYRKNVARLSARPYSLKVIGGSDPTIAPRMSAKLSQDYDRTRESIQDVRVRMGAEAFGMGVSKVYFDFIEREMQQRKALMRGNKVIYRDRKSMMQYQGASDAEIQQAVQQAGPEMSDPEVAQFLAKSGQEITITQKIPKYEGPIVRNVFFGRLYYRPFVRSLAESDYIGEDYEEDDLWCKKMREVTYTDPTTGEKNKKAFDPKVLDELLKLEPKPKTKRAGIRDLEDRFRNIEGKQTEDTGNVGTAKSIRKRYNIIEEHSKDEDGKFWITWVSEDYKQAPLGRMPYPCDTQGQWLYTAEVPLPDLIDAVGDSTPRLLRFQLAMYNLQTAQNFDYVTQTMRKLLLGKTGMKFGSEIVKFGNFDYYTADNPEAMKEFNIGNLPPGAMERGSQILQLLFMNEPSLSGIASGTEANPMAGKTATTSILAAKAADVLLQFKIDGRDRYLYELGMKKLAMYQQMAESKWSEVDDQGNPKYSWEISSKFFGPELAQLLSEQDKDTPPEWVLSEVGGSTSAIRLDPMEIQEDLEIEPQSGSYMAVDDQLKQDAALRLAGIAQQAPGIVNQRKVVEFAISTIRDAGNPQDFLLPEQTGPQPPPFKGNINISVQADKSPELMNQLLPEFGLQPIAENDQKAAAATMERVSAAADHAANLLSPSEEPQKQEQGPKMTVKHKKVSEKGSQEVSVTQ